jgi:hypothetical protein
VRPHGEATGETRAYHRPFLGDEVKSEKRKVKNLLPSQIGYRRSEDPLNPPV